MYLGVGLDGCCGAGADEGCDALPGAAALALEADEEEVVLLLCPAALEGALLGGEGGRGRGRGRRLGVERREVEGTAADAEAGGAVLVWRPADGVADGVVDGAVDDDAAEGVEGVGGEGGGRGRGGWRRRDGHG